MITLEGHTPIYQGESTDDKPTNVDTNTLFEELDTGYKYFYDGKGHFIMILSDGMGTGGRAAVDGAMASGLMARLLKAGFGYDCNWSRMRFWKGASVYH